MGELVLGTIALEPNRWTQEKRPFFRLVDIVERARPYGFSRFEVWQNHLASTTVEEMDSLVALSRDGRLSVPVLALYPVIRLPRGEAEAEMANILALARRSARLGTRALKIFVGDRGTETLTPEQHEDSIGFLGRLVDRAAGLGLRVLGETHPDTLFDSPESCLATIEAVGKGLGVCFQPYNFTDTETTTTDLRQLFGHVQHLHLQGRKGGQISRIAKADIDYQKVFEELSSLGYEGDMCIEFVEGCIVDDASEFDLDKVLSTARADRDYVVNIARDSGLAVTG